MTLLPCFRGAAALLAANLSHACEECGGKGKARWTLREREPKASQLYPDARIVEYTLDIAETTLSPAGRPVSPLICLVTNSSQQPLPRLWKRRELSTASAVSSLWQSTRT